MSNCLVSTRFHSFVTTFNPRERALQLLLNFRQTELSTIDGTFYDVELKIESF